MHATVWYRRRLQKRTQMTPSLSKRPQFYLRFDRVFDTPGGIPGRTHSKGHFWGTQSDFWEAEERHLATQERWNPYFYTSKWRTLHFHSVILDVWALPWSQGALLTVQWRTKSAPMHPWELLIFPRKNTTFRPWGAPRGAKNESLFQPSFFFFFF